MDTTLTIPLSMFERMYSLLTVCSIFAELGSDPELNTFIQQVEEYLPKQPKLK